MPAILLLLLILGGVWASDAFVIPLHLTDGFVLPSWLWAVLGLGLLTWLLRD